MKRILGLDLGTNWIAWFTNDYQKKSVYIKKIAPRSTQGLEISSAYSLVVNCLSMQIYI